MQRREFWKRSLIAGLALGLVPAIGMTSIPAAAADYDKVRLRYASFAPAANVRDIFTQKWMDEVTKRSGGNVTFDTYRDQALLQTTAMLDGTSRGIADIGYVAGGYFPTELPLTTLQDLPFLTNNTQALIMTVQQMYKEFDALRDEWDRQNLVLVGTLSIDPTIMGSREEWKGVADIKGKRIRAFGLINQTLQALGAIPVALPAPDIYTSMERKVIEGYSGLPAQIIPPWALHEVSKYVIDYGAGTYGNISIVMNKRKFDSLNEKTRAVLLDTFNDLLRDSYIPDITKTNHDRAKAIQANKMIFLRWSKEEREAARKIVSDVVWEEAVRTREARGAPARAFLNRFVELVKENEPKATDYIDPVSVALGRPD